MNHSDPFADYIAASRRHRTACENLHVPIAFLNDLTQATTQAAVLEIYSSWSKKIVAADRCSIALADGAEHLTVTTMAGSHSEQTDRQYDIGNSITGTVYTKREGMFIENLTGVPSSGAVMLADLGYKSLVLAPLCTGTKCFGVINAGFFNTLTDPGPVIAMLQAIGRCLATQLLVVAQMENLAEMALTDALTGAGNRYDLYKKAALAWEAWETERVPFSYLSIDIDHFKQINDTYGHDVGDAVLCAFVNRLRARSRTSDSVIRAGGEEFGMLMPGAELMPATTRAQRLCDAIGDSPFAVSGIQLTITASFGVTEVRPNDESLDDVLKRADMALYEAKAAGRDQVVSFDEADLAA